MRSIAYVVAALAAVGIMIAIVMMPAEDTARPTQPASGEVAQADAADAMATPAGAAAEKSVEPVGTLVLEVPDMHCPFACYPSVKKTLEGDASVAGVKLAQQKQEGVIDNPQVIVEYGDGFNPEQAIDALAKQGFADAEVVQ